MTDPENGAPELSPIDGFLAPFIKADRRKLGARRNQHQHPVREGQVGGSNSRVVLSIFDVPPGLLAHTALDDASSPIYLSDQAAGVVGSKIVHLGTGGGVGISLVRAFDSTDNRRGLTCVRCGLSSFESRPAQLAHFKSGLHMVNLRRQLSGNKPPLSQEQLDVAATTAKASGKSSSSPYDDDDAHNSNSGTPSGEDDSSGTESDETTSTGTATGRGSQLLEDLIEEGDGGDGDDGVGSLVPGSGQNEGNTSNKRGMVEVGFSLQEGPRLTFAPSGSAWCFSLSSAALGMERGDDPWERLDELVGDESGGGANNRLWAVLILSSGKFAAAVFEGQSVLCHKVFRRYTIRAKRGGSQSSYDSGGRKAQSAGAALRRYGEQALREDIRALLKEWEGPLKACRVVLTSVPKGMRTVLFDGKDAPFDRKDPRLRSVPFAVGKPVFEEVVAVHTRVTSIVFSDAASFSVSSSAGSTAKNGGPRGGGNKRNARGTAVAAAAVASEDPARIALAQQPAIFVTEPCPPSSELIDACKRGDVDAAATLLDRLELNGGVAAATNNGAVAGDGGEPVVAVAAEPPVARWTAADVIDHPDGLERLLTPLHVAAAGGHVAVLGVLLERGANPLAEDVRGRVPYLLAANKDTRDAFRRARGNQPRRWDWDAARVPEPLTEELEQRQKEKLKEKEKEKKRRAKLRKKAEKERAEEEDRQRKEQEKAKARDRRKRGLAAVGHCDACSKALVEKKALSRLEFRYCSSECVNLHKRKLAADAAERRFNGGVA